ncbi:AAA family ATPase [Svornostia abyssi]|uniref:AAA family ATPase n=1 Tax=Svornostia abyssi TaxID=2898438 RepID=A0ABY5PK27_9ACTN|nr:AAA family ATPase [Parviterribacteraceae bacterium J379]
MSDPGTQSVASLLEREDQERAMQAVLADAGAGAGSTVVVLGEAGVGKTALVARLVEQAAPAFTVLRARGDELEQDYPYGVVRQLLEPALRALAEPEAAWSGAASLARPVFGLEDPVAPVPAPDDGVFGRQQGLYWVCVNLAEALGPLLLVVDDAHRADDLSLRFLRFLGHRLDGVALVQLLATRPAQEIEGRPALADMIDDPTCRQLRVERLSEAATVEYVRRTWGDAGSRLGPACHELTAGNPLLLRALLAEAQRAGLQPAVARAEELRVLGARSIGHRVRRALESAPPAAMAIAQAVAVLGDDVDPSEAVAFAELDPADAAPGTDALLRLGYLDDTTRGLRFVHPLVRASVYRLLPPVERQGAHLRAAALLRARGAGSAELAAHLAAAPPAGEAWATEALAEAADQAFGLGAPETAVRYLRRALQEPVAPAARGALVASLARAEASAGEPGALERFTEAVELAPDLAARTAVSLEYAGALSMAGHTSNGFAVLREVVADQPGAPSAALRSALHAAALFAASPEALAFRDEEAERIDPAAPPPEDPTWSLLAAMHAIELALRGRPAADVEAVIVPAASSLCDLLDLSTGPQWGYGMWALMLCDQLDVARRETDRAVARGRRTGSVSVLGLALCLRSAVRLRQGDLAGAEADALESLALAEYPSWRFGAAASTQFLVQILLEQGRTDDAADAMAAVTDADRDRDALGVDITVEYAQALVRLRTRDAVGALAQAERLGRRMAEHRLDGSGFAPWREVAARAASGMEDEPRAHELAREHLGLMRAVGGRVSLAAALLCAAQVGAVDSASAADEAAELAAAAGAPLLRARALLAAGRTRRIAGDRTAAREPLHEAADIAGACGALATADAALEELAAAGGRPRRRDEGGAVLLTAAEMRVARLAADGASNREIAQELFVTQKTVEMHLSSAYRKLDIRSRTQLAARLGA